MYRLKPIDLVKNRFLGLWSLLAFQAGFINSIGFLACHRFVSHVTGFGSQVGVSLGRGQFLLALEMFSAPLFFIFGAWVNGHLTVARMARGERPYYDRVTFIMPLLILAMLLAGVNGLFGEFGEPLVLHRDFVFLSALSFVCGMQNACFATLTKGQIRTTHLTGISTDFGTDMSLIISGNLSKTELLLAKRRNIMRALTFMSFSTGAVVSALVDESLKYWSLGAPLATSLFVWGVFMRFKYELDGLYPKTGPLGVAEASGAFQTPAQQ